MNIDGKSAIVGAIAAAVIVWGIGQAKPQAMSTQAERKASFSSGGHFYGQNTLHGYRGVTDGAGGVLLFDDTAPGILLHYQKTPGGYFYDYIDAQPLAN